MREISPNMEFFWWAFSSLWTKYGYLPGKSPYIVRVQDNSIWKNSVFGNFVTQWYFCDYMFYFLSVAQNRLSKSAFFMRIQLKLFT